MSDALVERLRLCDTCAVSDALDRLGLPGAALGLSAASTDKRIVGRAVTVKIAPAGDQPAPRHLCTAAVEASGPGRIIVIAHNARTDVAAWGGLLSLGAVTRGAEGVVIDGACRDLDESRAYGLPVYARAAVPLTARGRVQEIDWNCPVEISGVAVAPDDLVIADASGVVFVPQASAESVLDLAEEIVARERAMADDIKKGAPISQVMGAKYETMTQKARS